MQTTRSIECLLATALLCGCLVWRFAAPPVTPEWVELLRLRKENALLLQRLKAHECPSAPSHPTAVAAPPCDDGAAALLSGSHDLDVPEDAASGIRSKGGGGHALGADQVLREQVLELQRELGALQQKEVAARALPAVLVRRAGAPQLQHMHGDNDTLLLAHAWHHGHKSATLGSARARLRWLLRARLVALGG